MGVDGIGQSVYRNGWEFQWEWMDLVGVVRVSVGVMAVSVEVGGSGQSICDSRQAHTPLHGCVHKSCILNGKALKICLASTCKWQTKPKG